MQRRQRCRNAADGLAADAACPCLGSAPSRPDAVARGRGQPRLWRPFQSAHRVSVPSAGYQFALPLPLQPCRPLRSREKARTYSLARCSWAAHRPARWEVLPGRAFGAEISGFVSVMPTGLLLLHDVVFHCKGQHTPAECSARKKRSRLVARIPTDRGCTAQ